MMEDFDEFLDLLAVNDLVARALNLSDEFSSTRSLTR